MTRIPDLAEKILFLQTSPHAQDICGHRDSQNSLCAMTGVARGALRYCIDNKRMSSDHQTLLAAALAFEITWPEWRTGTHQQFRTRYEAAYCTSATRAAAQAKASALRQSRQPRGRIVQLQVSRPQRFPPADDLLASLQIGTNQAGPNDPWPLTVELVCLPAPMDRVIVAVRRGKLAINCGQARTSGIEDRRASLAAYQSDSTNVTIDAGGDDTDPVWMVTAKTPPIDAICFSDGICRLFDVVRETVIRAEFRVYIKDLKSATPDEAPSSVSSHAVEHTSYSFSQHGRDDLETKTKNAILARIAELKLLGEGDWVVLCRDELKFDAASDGR